MGQYYMYIIIRCNDPLSGHQSHHEGCGQVSARDWLDVPIHGVPVLEA